MKTSKCRVINGCWIAGILVLLLLAAVHGLDVREGVTESGDVWLVSRYLAVAAAAIMSAAISGILLMRRRWRLEAVFALTALCFGLLFLYVLPPLSAPDEIRHYISAYDLSNRIMGIHSDDPQGRVPIRMEDWFAEDSCGDYEVEMLPDGTLAVREGGADEAKVLGQTLTEETYRLIHNYEEAGGKAETSRVQELSEKNAETVETAVSENGALSVHKPVVTTPCAYLMPALGITLARVIGLNTLWLLYLGRVFNLLLFVLVVSYAIHRIPFGKELLFGVSILPMTLHLAASYSYDVLLISGFFLLTAVCMDLAYQAEKVRVADIVLLAAVMAVAGPCKMVYAVFAGLCLLIPVKKFGGWGRWLISAACVLGAWVLAMVLINGQTVASYASETDNYISWAGEAGYSLNLLLHQPVHTMQMFFRTVVWQAELWHLSMLGAYLGNLDTVLDVPYLVILGLTGCLLALAFRKPGDQIEIRPLQKCWIWFLCLASAGALMLSMFLAWTPLSSRIICGVQGRYFLPFLPAFLLTLKNDTIVLTKNPDRSILYVMCCADAYVLMRIFSIVCMRL
jgi:uncharacterized membrane protein